MNRKDFRPNESVNEISYKDRKQIVNKNRYVVYYDDEIDSVYFKGIYHKNKKFSDKQSALQFKKKLKISTYNRHTAFGSDRYDKRYSNIKMKKL